MKKTALLIASAFLFSTAAHAHRVWVETAHTHGGEYLEAELGYGEFPELEPIAKDRLHIFSKPMQLVTEKGKGKHDSKRYIQLPIPQQTTGQRRQLLGNRRIPTDFLVKKQRRLEAGKHQRNA